MNSALHATLTIEWPYLSLPIAENIRRCPGAVPQITRWLCLYATGPPPNSQSFCANCGHTESIQHVPWSCSGIERQRQGLQKYPGRTGFCTSVEDVFAPRSGAYVARRSSALFYDILQATDRGTRLGRPGL